MKIHLNLDSKDSDSTMGLKSAILLNRQSTSNQIARGGKHLKNIHTKKWYLACLAFFVYNYWEKEKRKS